MDRVDSSLANQRAKNAAPSSPTRKTSSGNIPASRKEREVNAIMGAWGTGLYSGDFALDVRAVVAAVARVPLDEDEMVKALCVTEKSAAENPADEDHAIFWLVLADQIEKRGIFSARVRDAA